MAWFGYLALEVAWFVEDVEPEAAGGPGEVAGAGVEAQGGTTPLHWLMWRRQPVPSWRRLERHRALAAVWRALLRAGRRTLIRTAMMPITTRSSTGVKARRCGARWFMTIPRNATGCGPAGTVGRAGGRDV
jgi:hypothetical protein